MKKKNCNSNEWSIKKVYRENNLVASTIPQRFFFTKDASD